MHPTIFNTIFSDNNFIWCTETNNFWFYFYHQFWKVFSSPITPFVGYFFHQMMSVHFSGICFQVFNTSTQCSINTMYTNQYPSAQIQSFTEMTLPIHNCFWISDRNKFVKQNYLLQ